MRYLVSALTYAFAGSLAAVFVYCACVLIGSLMDVQGNKQY